MKKRKGVPESSTSDYTEDYTTTQVQPGLKSVKWTILILIIGFSTYSVYWSTISLLKFYFFQATVFDLGVLMQGLWNVNHLPLTLHATLFQLCYSGIVYLLIPLQYGGYAAMLIFQSLFLAAGSIVLYFISKHHELSPKHSLLLSLSYLLYFPLSGVNWFDFHYQALFPTLFLLGYFLYRTNRPLLSTIVFFLSASVRFPYGIFPLLFWVLALIEKRSKVSSKKVTVVALANVIFYVIFLFISYHTLENGYFQTHMSGVANPLLDFPAKILTIVVLLAPVAFVPLFSKKWGIFLIPFIGLMFVANSAVYEFPDLFQLQYSAAYIPFVFLGVVDVIENRRIAAISALINGFRSRHLRRNSVIVDPHKTGANKIVMTIMISSLICGGVYQVAAPLQTLHQDSIGIGSLFSLNSPEFAEYRSISTLIAPNDPNVLLQNNLPQFLPGVSGNNVRMAGFIGPNISNANITENKFAWNYGSFHGTTPIDYVLLDLGSPPWLHKTMQPNYPNLANLTNLLLASGLYGIKGQAGPFVVIQRGYTSLPIVFQPLILNFSKTSINLQNQTVAKLVGLPGNPEMTLRSTKPFAFGPGQYNLQISTLPKDSLNTSMDFGIFGLTSGYSNSYFFHEVSVNMTNSSSEAVLSFSTDTLITEAQAFVVYNQTASLEDLQYISMKEISLS